MLITGKELQDKLDLAHLHTYSNNYNLKDIMVNNVLNPYPEEVAKEMIRTGSFNFNILNHHPYKPMPGTGLWLASYNYETKTGAWIDHVVAMVRKDFSKEVPETLIRKQAFESVIKDGLYRATLADDARVLYLTSSKQIKTLFREADGSYFIDWEKLAEECDVVYFSQVAADFLTKQGYLGYEMTQCLVMRGGVVNLTTEYMDIDDTPNEHPHGLFNKGNLVRKYPHLTGLDEVSDDSLIFVVDGMESLSEVYDFRLKEFYYRGGDFVYFSNTEFFNSAKNNGFKYQRLISSKDIEFRIQ